MDCLLPFQTQMCLSQNILKGPLSGNDLVFLPQLWEGEKNTNKTIVPLRITPRSTVSYWSCYCSHYDTRVPVEKERSQKVSHGKFMHRQKAQTGNSNWLPQLSPLIPSGCHESPGDGVTFVVICSFAWKAHLGNIVQLRTLSQELQLHAITGHPQPIYTGCFEQLI